MSFLIRCPNCGERSVNDFRFGGEALPSRTENTSNQEWTSYYYFRRNQSGVQQEWWYHKFGCRKWFFALRDTRTNEMQRTYWPESEKS